MKIILLIYSPEDEEICQNLENRFRDHDSIWHFRYSSIKSTHDLENIKISFGSFDYIFYVFTNNSMNNMILKNEITEIEKEKYRIISYHGQVDAKVKSYVLKLDSEDDEFLKLIESVGGLESSIVKYAQIQKPSKINPFGAVRAEYFENSDIIASIFYPPEKQKYEYLISSRPVLIEGGRGSGKTMCLKSLDALTAIQRTNLKSLLDPDWNSFGIYIHVTRGSFVLTSINELKLLGKPQGNVLFLDDLNLQLSEQLLRTIKDCIDANHINISSNIENDLSNKISKLLDPEINLELTSFDNLISWIEKQKRHIRKFLAKKTMDVSYEYSGCFTEIDTFNKICKEVILTLSEFNNKTILVLLDEYENFLKPQQILVNTLIKHADNILSYKIAMKYGSLLTTTLYENQPLQETHDYYKIDLDYNIINDSDLKNFKNLLIGITKKMLHQKFAQDNIQSLLIGDDSDDRVSREQILDQLQKLFESKPDSSIPNNISYYKDTCIFRELFDHKMRKRQYSGFNSFAYLSSGIVRFFLELCGMAFYLAEDKGIDVFSMKEIPKEIQTESVHTISNALLDKLALGIEDHGELMQRLVMNIGELLRSKLLYDNNEPETIGIGITGNYESWSSTLKELVTSGTKESVFQRLSESQKKKEKNISDPSAVELYLNRIYAPALGISHTARWRTIKLTAEELNEFILGGRTSKTKLRMIYDLKKNRKIDPNQKLDEHLNCD